MDKTDRLRDYGLAFLLYEQGLGLCGYELIRELFIFVKLILNSYLFVCIWVKNENKSPFILFFASFFVPLRMDSAGAASRHFSKNKALTIIVVFRKKRRKLSF